MALPLVAGVAAGVWVYGFGRTLARRVAAGRRASREARQLTDDRLAEWIASD